MDPTLQYYQYHAAEFVDGTQSVDMNELYNQFLTKLSGTGSILDIGCGSGRDTMHFNQLGYDVMAFDGSEAIVKLASQQAKFPVLHATFTDFTTERCFDGMWACASLLHVPLEQQTATITHLVSFLKPNGIFYASYKLGQTETHKAGRYFCNMDAESFAQVIKNIPDLTIMEHWITGDQRPGRASEQWFNVLLQKTSPT
jgi:2-polyprenyl-3-methyl-5-hydroxy-6-metoxy-1,4-benzoquinol methylase